MDNEDIGNHPDRAAQTGFRDATVQICEILFITASKLRLIIP
jgi:hypothetical protein